MSRDEEAQLRCSKNNLNDIDEKRCKILCHENCLGCIKSNSSVSCVKCRYHGKLSNDGVTCFDSCPLGFVKDKKLQKCFGRLFRILSLN